MSDWGWYECQKCATPRKVDDIVMTETERLVFCKKCRMRTLHGVVGGGSNRRRYRTRVYPRSDNTCQSDDRYGGFSASVLGLLGFIVMGIITGVMLASLR